MSQNNYYAFFASVNLQIFHQLLEFINIAEIFSFFFSEKVLEDLVNGFFGAGSETIRLTVEWLILTAAVHQDAQRRVQHEIDEVVGKDQPITWLDHNTMPFTEAFILEVMRWRTVIPINILRS